MLTASTNRSCTPTAPADALTWAPPFLLSKKSQCLIQGTSDLCLHAVLHSLCGRPVLSRCCLQVQHKMLLLLCVVGFFPDQKKRFLSRNVLLTWLSGELHCDLRRTPL